MARGRSEKSRIIQGVSSCELRREQAKLNGESVELVRQEGYGRHLIRFIFKKKWA